MRQKRDNFLALGQAVLTVEELRDYFPIDTDTIIRRITKYGYIEFESFIQSDDEDLIKGGHRKLDKKKIEIELKGGGSKTRPYIYRPPEITKGKKKVSKLYYNMCHELKFKRGNNAYQLLIRFLKANGK